MNPARPLTPLDNGWEVRTPTRALQTAPNGKLSTETGQLHLPDRDQASEGRGVSTGHRR